MRYLRTNRVAPCFATCRPDWAQLEVRPGGPPPRERGDNLSESFLGNSRASA